VTDSSDTDSMLWFWLEKGGDDMKCCQKIKRMQYNSVVTSIGGDATPKRRKEGDDAN
jgi:hypothetical protein